LDPFELARIASSTSADPRGDRSSAPEHFHATKFGRAIRPQPWRPPPEPSAPPLTLTLDRPRLRARLLLARGCDHMARTHDRSRGSLYPEIYGGDGWVGWGEERKTRSVRSREESVKEGPRLRTWEYSYRSPIIIIMDSSPFDAVLTF
jgi:hypothetical protein